jgi:hypothetical protein
MKGFEVPIKKAPVGRCPQSVLERVKGIEPSSKAWEAFVLPLNYTRMGSILRSFDTVRQTYGKFDEDSNGLTDFICSHFRLSKELHIPKATAIVAFVLRISFSSSSLSLLPSAISYAPCAPAKAPARGPVSDVKKLELKNAFGSSHLASIACSWFHFSFIAQAI